MTRRITCYIIFVTLIWGAHTEDEEKVRDMFKSNMTRHDFSNLLKSLINLNEQRVSVLQKLYRLEDYGVLSEVLRSGDKKTGNGNRNDLFLIVMSKNQNDPSRRNVGFQVVDSVSSLDAGKNNIHPKLDFVLDPAGYISQNIRNENRFESIFENVPMANKPTKIHQANDRSKKITTTTKTLKYNKIGLRAVLIPDGNVLRALKTSLKSHEDRKHHKDNSRFEIVSNKEKHPNASEKLINVDGRSNIHPQTVGYSWNSQSDENLETDFPIKNDKLTTKSIIIKHILSSNHKKSKSLIKGKGEQDEDDYSSPFSNIQNDRNRQYTKKHHGSDQHNPKTNKYIRKVKAQSKQQSGKLSTKPIIIEDIITSNHQNTKYPTESKDEQDEDYYGSPFSNIENDHNNQYTKKDSGISIKKLHISNHHNPKTNKNNPKAKAQKNQQNDKLATKWITIKDMLSSNRQNTKYPLENKDEQEEDFYGSPFSNIENDHNSQNNTNTNSDISIKKLHINNHHIYKNKKITPKEKNLRNQQNDKLSTKPIIIEDIITSHLQNTKYALENKDEQDEDLYGSLFSDIENDHNSQNTNINSDIAIKKFHVNNHHNSKKEIFTPKEKVQRNQQNDKLSTKPIIIEDIITSNRQNTKYPLENKDEQDDDFYGSPFINIENDQNSQNTNINSDISIKRLHVNNHHSSKTNLNTPKEKVQRNQQNDKLSTKSIIIEDIITSNRQNTKYPLENKDEQDEDFYGSPFINIENDHNSQNTNMNSDYSIKKLDVIHHNPIINNNTPNIEFQSNQYLKLNKNKSNLNNQGNRNSKLRIYIKTTTRKQGYRIKYGTVKTDAASENNHSIKNTNLNNNNTNVNNHATKEINNNKFLTLASENIYGSKPVIPETINDTQYEIYPGFEDHKDVRDISNKDKPKTVIDTPYGSYPGLEHLKVDRDNSNKDMPKTAKDTPFGNFHGFEHLKNVMDNKDNPNTAKEFPYRDNRNAESKKDTDYYGVKLFDSGKKSNEQFSIIITNVGNGTAEEVKQQNDPKLILNAYDQHESKPIARKPFKNCLTKRALKLCCKSCISAYKNVCQRLKCTSRSKKALKKECKRSCKKSFRSSSSKYSDGSSDETSDDTSDDYS